MGHLGQADVQVAGRYVFPSNLVSDVLAAGGIREGCQQGLQAGPGAALA